MIPEKIKSLTPINGVLTDVFIEEATEVSYEAMKQLNKRLRGRSNVNKRLTLTFNPVLKDHWIYKEYFNAWEDNKTFYRDEQLSILKTTYKDNDFLEPDDIYNLENEMDKYFYEVYTLGNWGLLGNVIFKNWEVQDLSEIRKTFDQFHNGLDFGYSQDPNALVHMYYDKKKKFLYILDELYISELTNDLLAEKVKKIIHNGIVTCDSSEPKSIQELKNYGIHALSAKKGKDSVNFGIDWLKRQKIIINTTCPNTKLEFQKYRWKEDRFGNVLPVPVDKDNHLLDAIRYGMESEMNQSKFIFV